MNYRHAFHAGNFADCFKHALLLALLDALNRKPTPYCVIDTHAGAGHYDLTADPAQRTQEAETGIHRLLARRPQPLSHYLEQVAALGLYPGSPALIRAAMRPGDRLVCCELHPQDAATLKHLFRRDRQTEVHQRSAWEAMGALLPPREKRGLVFIDPSFEDRAEFATLAEALKNAHTRFAHGILAAWYPVKQKAAVTNFHAVLRHHGIRDIIAIEMHLRAPLSAETLNGCGLVIINPPYLFGHHAKTLAESVLAGVGAQEDGEAVSVQILADE